MTYGWNARWPSALVDLAHKLEARSCLPTATSAPLVGHLRLFGESWFCSTRISYTLLTIPLKCTA